jgi:outer membrane protein
MSIPISTRNAHVGRARVRSAMRVLALAVGFTAWISPVGACQQPGAATGATTLRDARGVPDTVLGLGPRVSLETVIARWLVYSPTVAIASGVVRDAWANRLVTVGAYLPTLTLNSVNGYSNQIINTGTSATIPVENTYGAGLATAYNVYTGGLRPARRAQADWLIRSANAGLTLQRYAATFGATQGYLNVLRAHDLIGVAADEVAQAALGLEYVLRREAVGTAMRADVLSAQLALSTARQAQLAAVDTLTMTAAALGRLVGADGPVDTDPNTRLDFTPLSRSDSAILVIAMTTAPAVLSTRAQATADTAGVRAAKSFYRPTVTITGSYNRAKQSRVPAGLRPGFTVLLGTSFPLFDGYLRALAVTQAEVLANVDAVTAMDTRRLSRSNAQQLLGNLHVAEHDIELTRESVRLATENLRIFRARYSAGISTILDVLTAQTSLVQAQLSFVSARYMYQSTRAALEALLGQRL